MAINEKLRNEIDYMARDQELVDEILRSQISEVNKSKFVDFDASPLWSNSLLIFS